MKKISMILFALMGLFLTTACGGGGDDGKLRLCRNNVRNLLKVH